MFISRRFALCIILFIGIIFHEEVLFAADVCSVSNQASPEFVEYQNKLSSELAKIRGEMAAKTCGATPFSNTSLEREQAKGTDLMYSIVNETRDLNMLQSSFQFNISRLLTADDLPLLRRERSTLTSQAKAIEQTIDEMFGRCAQGLPYGGTNTTLQSHLSELYADHIRFTAHFESVASGYETVAKLRIKLPFPLTPKIIGNNSEWLSKITNAYGPTGLKPCYEEGVTMMETWKRIVKIWTNGANISKGMQAWKDAFKLLMGTDPNYNAKQKKLLSSYLSENGITGDARDGIMERLDCMQRGGACGFPVDLNGEENIKKMASDAGDFYDDVQEMMVGFRKKSKEAQNQYMNSLTSYQGDGGIAGAFKNLKNAFVPVPDVNTQSIIDDNSYAQDLNYVHSTTKSLYDTLKAKSSSDFTDKASLDSLKAINEQVYKVNLALEGMEKLSIYMCKSQDISQAGLCIK